MRKTKQAPQAVPDELVRNQYLIDEKGIMACSEEITPLSDEIKTPLIFSAENLSIARLWIIASFLMSGYLQLRTASLTVLRAENSIFFVSPFSQAVTALLSISDAKLISSLSVRFITLSSAETSIVTPELSAFLVISSTVAPIEPLRYALTAGASVFTGSVCSVFGTGAGAADTSRAGCVGGGVIFTGGITGTDGDTGVLAALLLGADFCFTSDGEADIDLDNFRFAPEEENTSFRFEAKLSDAENLWEFICALFVSILGIFF